MYQSINQSIDLTECMICPDGSRVLVRVGFVRHRLGSSSRRFPTLTQTTTGNFRLFTGTTSLVTSWCDNIYPTVDMISYLEHLPSQLPWDSSENVALATTSGASAPGMSDVHSYLFISPAFILLLFLFSATELRFCLLLQILRHKKDS